jgi:DNA adenine methylase
MAAPQTLLFDTTIVYAKPFRTQLLKWIGNKQRFAHEIISYFPPQYNVYREPFLGSGAVLGTLAPSRAVGSDAFEPLIEIWQTLHDDPEKLKSWYAERWHRMRSGDKVTVYSQILDSYNAKPNGADLLFLSRSCYGGVVRWRQDGFMSTPCGPHDPISPQSFAERVDVWQVRTSGARFVHKDYKDAIEDAGKGDLIYCDPPYTFTQSILYGAQNFSLVDLFERIRHAKEKGVSIALSIDGSKKSGDFLCDIRIPDGLFAREVLVNCGRSMLKRFQMDGKSLESEVVHDRLLLTY